ncbi:MAG: Gfo/Idh/MocA family oxidoreductase [Chloroflexi bacterium]|nr:Gfo/Idh/MocA family oxidoreductase [Chloroflexota bacterium]
MFAPVKVGVIGCGYVSSQFHLPALKNNPHVELVAVADIVPERAQRAAQQFEVAHHFTDENALIAADIDAVAVCSPPSEHERITIAALRAGKHVLVEKPLALTLDACDRMIEAAAQAGCKTMMGFNLRWHRLVQQASQQISQIGEPLAISSHSSSHHFTNLQADHWRRQPGLGGDPVLDQFVHHFDLWCDLLDTSLASIYAVGDETSVSITALLANGVHATSFVSERTAHRNRLTYIGDSGRLDLELNRFDGLQYTSLNTPVGGVSYWTGKLGHFARQFPNGVRVIPKGGDFVLSYPAMWQHFIDCIGTDTSPVSSFADGRRAVAAALAANESRATGLAVRLQA